MKNKLLETWQGRIKREHKIAFFATFILVLLIHMYMFVNNLQSEDSMYNYYNNQDMTVSGRWALSFFCSFSSYFHTSWIIGLIATVFISLTVVLITEIFEVKNPVTITLIGGLFASANFIANTARYVYTIDGYMIAMFLATLAVYLTGISEKRISRYVLSAILLCLSCAIYQAYIPFALVLVIYKTIDFLIKKEENIKDLIGWLIKQAIMFAVSLGCYYLIWKFCLYFYNRPAETYLGISEVGKLNIDMIIRGLKVLPLIVNKFFFGDEKLYLNVPYSMLNVIFIIMAFIAIIYVFIKKKMYKEKSRIFLYVLCFLAIVPCSCFWIFTSEVMDASNYWPRALSSLFLIYVFVLIMYEKYCSKYSKNIFMFLIIVMVFNNAILTNILYVNVERVYLRSYADGFEMVVKIREVIDDYKEKNPNKDISKIVFVGTKVYEVSYPIYDMEEPIPIDYAPASQYLSNVKDTLIWDGSHATPFISSNFELGFDFVWDQNDTDSYLDKNEVKNMGIWPANDSVAVIDGDVVVKISDQKEGSI